jgi:hypothetical protein
VSASSGAAFVAWCLVTAVCAGACSDTTVVGRERQTCTACAQLATTCPTPTASGDAGGESALGGGVAFGAGGAAANGGSAGDGGVGAADTCLPVCDDAAQAWADFDACACAACKAACGGCPATPLQGGTFACYSCRADKRAEGGKCATEWKPCSRN